MTATGPSFHLVVPGTLDQRTGGTLYDARIVSELGQAGTGVEVHSVPGNFPNTDDVVGCGLDTVLEAIADDEIVVVDGLASGGLPVIVDRHADRLAIVALVHHPLADETGQTDAQIERFFALERETLGHVRGVVVTSPFTARRLADFDVTADRVRVIEPGTDPAPLAEGPGEAEPPRLVCVAALSPRKGHDLLVEALYRLRDLEWTCVCAGSTTRDADFASRVSQQIDRHELSHRIRLVGELDRDALEEVYQGASLFVLPSHYEGYGMAYAEALTRGIPVVGTTGGAIPDTVPGRAGVLVPPGDVEALTTAIRDLLVVPSRRETLAEGARTHAASLPGWRDQAIRFREAVASLAGGSEVASV